MSFNTLFSKLNSIPVLLSGAAVIAMMLHVCADVIGKYLFNAPVPGTITIVTDYYMPIVTFLPLAYVHRLGSHISVEVVTNLFSTRVQYHIHYFGMAISLMVFALLTFTTFEEALKKYTINTFMMEQGIKIATWPGQFFLPVGYGLIALLILHELITYVLGRPDAKGPA
jgi:TRAP-type C4-dicarboxylate transport system permease small subunit